MGYVPGYENDVFLSYAHGDDSAWLQAFEQALARAVRDRLGHEVRVWQDLKRLRVGKDWPAEIEDGIKSSAAFVAVLTPSYQNSDWCSREWKTFLGPDVSAGAPAAGDPRLFKVVKIPWENNDHEAFLPRLQHVAFFRSVDGPEEYIEYPMASDAFRSALQQTAAGIKTLLRTMRRQLQMVFVASPADDMLDSWNRVRVQLMADRYDVRPDARLSSAYEDKIVLRDLENAVLTVHLLGPSYDEFAERQFKLAADAGRRQLVWMARGTERQEDVDPRQWKLLESIRRKETPQTELEWFRGTAQEMIMQIQGALKPKPVAGAVDESAGPRIYLIHDPTTREDADFAGELQAALREREKLDVVFPPAGVNSGTEFYDRHRRQLEGSDGVLLYWKAAPETWFDQNVRDVLFPGRKAKLRSKAVMLGDPSYLDGQPVQVIKAGSELRLGDLEPFLEPLRNGGATRASA